MKTVCIVFLLVYFIILPLARCQYGESYSVAHLKNGKSFSHVNNQTAAVLGLLKRVLGEKSSDFDVSVDLPYLASGRDTVKLTEPRRGHIKIQGTSGVAVAFGLNHYLKYYCRKQISWAGDQMDMPTTLPSLPPGGLQLDAGVKYRYYQNVCTVSYSSVWWKWERWEREIDWMAMNGINLPLAFTGQEAIWRRVFKQLGCSDEDLDNFFAGPAFLAWGRMGNIYKWGGPLPTSWTDNQLSLQHQILVRMRSLGMIPVLPGFAGHIPAAITKLYPDIKYEKLGSWSHFNCTYSCTYFLEPQDPFFLKIGKMFIDEQIKEYNGTNHIYSADTFNEMMPRSSDPDYLAQTSQGVYNAMLAADDKAIWLMQGWLFHNEPSFWKAPQIKAFLTAVPQGKMIILDLFSEAYPYYNLTSSYFGQPFIWCMLHNFGGNTGFYGKIEAVNQGPLAAMSYPNSTMIGTGVTPEGINQNYFIYDLMLEVGFFVQPTNLTNWVTEYVKRRYATDNQDAINTWLTFARTVYNDTNPGYPPKRMIRGPMVDRPTTNLPQSPTWYIQSSFEVWDTFMKALPHLAKLETVKYDTVDITRQMLQAFHFDMVYSLIQAFERKDELGVNVTSTFILEIFDDLDAILTSNVHFLMGRWIHDARAMGATDQEKDLYEFNARNQVTLWGPMGEIHDYASKQWGSLTAHYYRPRWALFIKYVTDCVKTGHHFNHGKFSQDVFENVEKPFNLDRTLFPYDPIGDSIELAQKIYKKYQGERILRKL